MKDYSQIEEVLNKQNIPHSDQEIIKNFFASFSFTKRQQLMGILLGFPEKAGLFVGLLKKKIEFEKNPTEALSAEILEIEEREIRNLMSELK
ncbi:MAG: hypothetical protein UW27_C0010G0025 [Parcubacteria group bacterium GW2011_GWA1_44_13]|uniref:Uncharacterized protein n=1 Tax=Candidatus Nomurabacteria bacterium GW2011_GWB1_44_12 TaxID=1618748 RepID=A0A837IDM1_9BACT|nr:MAG: hypothetical protein UW25_C0004G0299 [Candidatus Nomurabacteria bacterium GW2011_GWB1_44_12]KKT37745.1 MAG: hypothetical protein UW27_C0010G0025 [Parcubacteria group bacterium GW2011_GWA1_44_13]KKT59171.1 MAG: hypothetical protein UW54_C0033G0006 [Parcubacteria group bacterium GW2011_GWC1_44_26]HBB43972.1 hypothetical protein [Candidatus Yonathbacteria bacterium]